MSGEQVLVVPAAALRSLPPLYGLTIEVGRWSAVVFDPENLSYLPRAAAETDESHLQLVSYAVLTCGERVFTYHRGAAGGETRLHAKRSLGVGGHINPVDGPPGRDAYLAGHRRELAEEVVLPAGCDDRIVGFLHDPSTPVGRVHLGVVHRLGLPNTDGFRVLDAGLVDGAFRPLPEVRRPAHEFESWSRFVLAADLLGGKAGLTA